MKSYEVDATLPAPKHKTKILKFESKEEAVTFAITARKNGCFPVYVYEHGPDKVRIIHSTDPLHWGEKVYWVDCHGVPSVEFTSKEKALSSVEGLTRWCVTEVPTGVIIASTGDHTPPRTYETVPEAD